MKRRVTARDEKIVDLTGFKTLAISSLAAQHDEIERLRRRLAQHGNVRALPVAGAGQQPEGHG
ncbi:hypothetical protein OG892_01675 [Streptomyces sp. NBC_00341]|uniref:hypothetical protein n=1 Tax=Streptomyces sp. NBC_00341 TaxID=2975717 RepID=UPI003092200D|nr:hypothetical protein OG892_01675 [Streptomyces sp. NBC_00341]